MSISRDQKILQLHNQGIGNVELAERFGLTTAGVRRLLSRVKAAMKNLQELEEMVNARANGQSTTCQQD